MRNFSFSILFFGLLFDGQESPAAEPVDYLREVKPILAARCHACHGALQQKGGLRLDTADFVRQGGDSGPAVRAGKVAASLLIERITGAGGVSRMPPAQDGTPLEDKEIALLKAWIDQGAKAPAEIPPPDPRRHWAFKTPVRAIVPEIPSPYWGRNPVDAFLAANHKRHGLQASPPIQKELLLRRVYFDLIGLPPSREALHAFLADTSLEAYERVVDRLLASPRYGERWCRHWMDIWRYHSDSRPYIWRWRDWIIESLNRDKGYDRMILEMLAGDELAPEDPDVLRATGFLARNSNTNNNDRNRILDDIVQHTARGILGLSLQCARCHDHKYDPISQVDYYQFRAFFESHGVRENHPLARFFVYEASPETPTYLFLRGDPKNPDKSRSLRPQILRILRNRSSRSEIIPVALPQTVYCPDLADRKAAVAQTREEEATVAHGVVGRVPLLLMPTFPTLFLSLGLAQHASSQGELARLEVRLAEVRYAAVTAALQAKELEAAGGKATAEWKRLATEAVRQQREEARLIAHKRLAKAQMAAASARSKADKDKMKAAQNVADATRNVAKAEAILRQPLTTAYVPPEIPYSRSSTGRRLALARSLVDRDNPLTARVAVNHMWTRHFGEPLVSSMSDFGLRIPRPIHHELLDWLAVEFMESGWSMKHLHRLLVTSEAYRMRSGGENLDDPNRRRDPDNNYFWRMNDRRLEAEVVRDTLLCLAGRLDDQVGGPDLPIEEAETTGKRLRRTIYYNRSEESNFLALFDASDGEECYLRKETIRPQQALALSNGKLTLTLAAELAASIGQEVGPGDTTVVREAFITSAFARILGRAPTSRERAICVDALTEFAADQRATLPQARAMLVHILLNHHDFITVR
jgi:mono/diheme cytochrome c family protein